MNYRLSRTLTDPALQSAARSSFASWNAIPASGSQPAPPIRYAEFVDANPAAVSSTADAKWGGDPDGYNNVVWIDGTNGNWSSITTAPDNVIAVTRLRYDAVTGEIKDADIAMNRQSFNFGVIPGG